MTAALPQHAVSADLAGGDIAAHLHPFTNPAAHPALDALTREPGA
ncbi:hypothetical protein [Cupriavidus campinensis]